MFVPFDQCVYFWQYHVTSQRFNNSNFLFVLLDNCNNQVTKSMEQNVPCGAHNASSSKELEPISLF
jgi:hypothetical protein